MGGTVFTDTAGVGAASAALRRQARAVAADAACRRVAITGDGGMLTRAIADIAHAEEQVAAATSAELHRLARLLEGLREDAVAADR